MDYIPGIQCGYAAEGVWNVGSGEGFRVHVQRIDRRGGGDASTVHVVLFAAVVVDEDLAGSVERDFGQLTDRL